MRKDDKDEATSGGKEGRAAAGTDGKQNSADNEASGSDEIILKPVRPKIGESRDNLKKRSDYFQKRHGGG